MLKPEKIRTPDGLEVYSFRLKNQKVLRIEFIFEAGKVQHENPKVPFFANNMLNEGTKTRTAAQIASEIDSYGSYLNLEIGKHYAYVSLYCLSKHLSKSLPIIKDIIRNAIFPEKELKIVKASDLQRYRIMGEQTDVMAYEFFQEKLFGSHPYGRMVKEEDFASARQADIRSFYQSTYASANPLIIISGDFEDADIRLLDDFFAKPSGKKEQEVKFGKIERPPAGEIFYLPKKGAVQCSLVYGKLSIKKTHPDFFDLAISSAFLGGYFGSRLMKNIREEKGYTYGIYSAPFAFRKAGVFLISAETGLEHTEDSLREIDKELKRLQNETVDKEELERVKNYLSSKLARSFDGIFAASDAFRRVLLSGSGTDFYEKYFERLKAFKPEDIQKTAKKYFSPESMFAVIAGKEKP